jgi:hypothetical protein
MFRTDEDNQTKIRKFVESNEEELIKKRGILLSEG